MALICRLSGGCCVPSRSAAPVMCPSSATATIIRRCLSYMAYRAKYGYYTNYIISRPYLPCYLLPRISHSLVSGISRGGEDHADSTPPISTPGSGCGSILGCFKHRECANLSDAAGACDRAICSWRDRCLRSPHRAKAVGAIWKAVLCREHCWCERQHRRRPSRAGGIRRPYCLGRVYDVCNKSSVLRQGPLRSLQGF